MFRLLNLFRKTTPASEPAMSSTCEITSATLDKPSYASGDTMTLTAVRSATATTEATNTIDVGAKAADGTDATGVQVSVTIDVTAPQSSVVSVSDSSGRTWAQESDDGTTSVWTATA